MHAIRVIREDHARIEALLEALEGADRATRAKRSERLTKELVVHTIAEDNIFLPHVEEAVEDSNKATEEFFDEDADVLAEASELIAESYGQNGRIRDLLQRLQPVPSGEEIDGLRKAIERHTGLEEELFPKARKVLEDEDLERIGDLMEHCKWQVRGLAQARLASSSSYRPSSVEATLSE